MRFTLKTMLVAVAVTAAICCVFFALPYWLSLPIIGLFWFMAPAAMIAGIVYAPGYGRAFAIGCVSAGGVLPLIYLYGLLIVLSGFDGLDSLDDEGTIVLKFAAGLLTVLVGLSGLVSMGVRWFFLRSQGPKATAAADTAAYSLLHGRVTTMQLESEPITPEPQSNAVPLTS